MWAAKWGESAAFLRLSLGEKRRAHCHAKPSPPHRASLLIRESSVELDPERQTTALLRWLRLSVDLRVCHARRPALGVGRRTRQAREQTYNCRAGARCVSGVAPAGVFPNNHQRKARQMFGRGKKAKAENLIASGLRGVGIVTDVRDTGMTVNDNPRVKMTFRVEPLDGSAAFEAKKTSTVSRVAIPRAGDRYPVWYDGADPETWMYAVIADDNGRQQIRSLFGVAAETMTGMGSPAVATVTVPVPTAPEEGPLERLQKLSELRAAGVLDEAEFEATKARILAGI
jgi:Short C-terminal domain